MHLHPLLLQPMLTALRNSKLFLIGFAICAILSVIAILGYCITPDSSTNANRIVQSWKNLPPGSTQYYKEQKKHPSNASISSIELWLYGNPNPNPIIPLSPAEITEPINNDNQSSIKSIKFWLGTDQFGRDVLSRMIIGSRVSLTIGFVAMLSSLIIGIIIGLTAGYFGGITDKFLSWLIAVFWSVPTLLIAMGLSLFLPKGLYQVMVATALSTWVEVARVVRGQTLQFKEREFIMAAKINGFPHWRIMLLHILPNTKGSLTVLATTNFAAAILLEAVLGFLGLGVSPPTPTWGMMVKENMGYLVLDNAYMALIPGFAIMILVMGFNLMSMGLRDLMDTNSK